MNDEFMRGERPLGNPYEPQQPTRQERIARLQAFLKAAEMSGDEESAERYRAQLGRSRERETGR